MIGFAISEGWRNFRNLGIYGLLTIISLTITLVIFGISASGFNVVKSWRMGLLGRFEIEAFLYAEVDSITADSLYEQIRQLEAVSEVQYVSKEQASRRFSEQFGPELFELMGYNPLPASFIVRLKPESDPSVTWETAAKQMRDLKGIEDVVYQGDLLASVDRFYRRAGIISIIIFSMMAIISLLFTVMTVVGVIKSRHGFIRIIALSGGSRMMASGPFVAMGFYFGLISGVFALFIVYITSWIIGAVMGIGSALTMEWALAVFGLGILVGTSGAALAARRYIRIC